MTDAWSLRDRCVRPDGHCPQASERPSVALIAEGASNKAIGRKLSISVHTVKFHIASLLEKLDAEGRAEAAAQGARIGAIKL
jgi:DNA-binding CsgD family transcriptional regulator